MQRHVRQQFQRFRKTSRQRTRGNPRRVRSRTRIQRRSQVRRAIRNLQRRTRRRSLLQHPRRHARQPRPIHRIHSAPRVQNQIRRHQRQSRPLAVQHRQSIRKLEFFRHRQVQRARDARLWRFLAPCRILIHRLAVILRRILLRRFRRRHFCPQILLPGHAINHCALIRIQLALARTPESIPSRHSHTARCPPPENPACPDSGCSCSSGPQRRRILPAFRAPQ